MFFRSACRWALWSLRPAGFEHAQHAIGDQEAADDVAGGGDDGDGAENRGEIALVFAGENDSANYGDGVQRVGEGHQRGVQQRGYAANDFKSDEGGEHENVQAGDQVQLHVVLLDGEKEGAHLRRRALQLRARSFIYAPPLVASTGNWKNSRRRALTTSPDWVSSVSRMISSAVLSCNFPSLTRWTRKAVRLRAYIWLA